VQDPSQQLGPTESTGEPVEDRWVPSALEQERAAYRSARTRRSAVVATASTLAMLGAIVALVVSSPGWPRVKETFFSWDKAVDSLPAVLDGLWLNIRVMLVCCGAHRDPRPDPGRHAHRCAVRWPSRCACSRRPTSTCSAGLPLLLVLFLLGFGAPALQLSGVPNSALFWGGCALVLSYSAYVAEVFRAGIESCTPRSGRRRARSG
jgi:polar amino acid transport system permease protein